MTADNYVEGNFPWFLRFVDGDEMDEARNTPTLAKTKAGQQENSGAEMVIINKWHVRDGRMHRKKGLWGPRRDADETGTYNTSVQFAGIRLGKPLKNRIDPCQ